MASANNEHHKTVKIGYYQSHGFQEGDGDSTLRSGYGYEYLQKVSAYTGWKYEYISGDWDELYQQLKKGKIDLMAGVSYEKEREKQIFYSKYEMLEETFYIYKDANDETMRSGEIASFSGKKIGVINNSKMISCIKKWKQDNHANIKIMYYQDLDACAAAFNKHKIAAFVGADNMVSTYTGISPIEKIGKEPYYICISKDRSDLLEELNAAVSIMNSQDSLYLETLRNKYSADTSIQVFLSKQEREWMNDHPTITVGYLNHYLPYSDTEDDGTPTGLISEMVPNLFASLPGDYKPNIKYRSFESYDQMIAALKHRAVDFVFPISGGISSSETSGYQQSSTVVSSSTDLVYTGKYSKHTIDTIAVNRGNQLQYYYTIANYPKAKIIYADTIEDCIKLVKKKKAGSTIMNALRVGKLLDGDDTLRMIPLKEPDEKCFGVNFGDKELLLILNHGISILGDGYGLNHAYPYISELVSYTAKDFLKAHKEIIYLLVLLILIGMMFVFFMRYQILQKRAEKEAEQKQILEEALKRAQQSSYAKQIFLNNMSHDIRTPLNGILGILEMNGSTNDPAILKENRKKAKDAIHQLLDLVNNAIELSKLEGTKKDSLEPIDLAKITDDILEIKTKDAEEAGITFKRECENKETWPMVYGNSLYIQEILLHIIENAIKYNKPFGSIIWKDQLTYQKNLEDVLMYQCEISDTGIGMKEEFLTHIFEPFMQEKIDARTVYQGAGLGMSIVKTLIDQSGGTINIVSTPEVGTSVFFTLPFPIVPEKIASEILEFEENELEIKEDIEAKEKDLSGLTLLLVEDNELNVEVAKFMLEEAKATVAVANNGEEAVKIYLDHPANTFDAILMDIMMPVMNGYEAARAIRSSKKEDANQIPIIATTACVSEESKEECGKSGMDDFLEKPLDLEKMIQVLMELTSKNH